VLTDWFSPPDRYVAPWDVSRVVGARIHALRLEAELSVDELAERAHMTPKRIRYYERGLLGITLPSLARIAHALELDVIDLVWDLRHAPPRTSFRGTKGDRGRAKRLRGQGAESQAARRRETARITKDRASAET
jgi:transcriptional regulator with XRE-family HTH domain